MIRISLSMSFSLATLPHMYRPPASILIVDDEPSVLSALKRELRDTAPIYVAQDPEEAHLILRENTIGLVISDYKMPKKDGITFLSELTELNYEPVKILMTAFSDSDIAVNAINRAGIFYFLKKPWNSNELTLLVERALEAYNNKNELGFCRQRLREIENIKNNISNLLTHELKTPLTTISGYTELLSKHIDDAQIKDVVLSLQNSVNKLEDFIDDTLYIAKIESGQVQHHPTNINLKDIVLKTFPSIVINEELSINLDKTLIEESFTRLARYLSQHNSDLSGLITTNGNYIVLKIQLNNIDKKPANSPQLAFF
ncbi:MAG: response regulator, partial [bacterium]